VVSQPRAQPGNAATNNNNLLIHGTPLSVNNYITPASRDFVTDARFFLFSAQPHLKNNIPFRQIQENLTLPLPLTYRF